ncbi:Glycosyl transferase, group 2 family protein [Vibrio fluvialis I21563]|uniref:glycosyltransferase n=1 Tax=Vibrio fluvialis TaxID=676 RepID=UPI0003571B55|nr:glycosyltransferase [Vibrio fluvialis]EPP25902.1 Glycosyl transferase, group 2 family protein [Vibrio fluvialis I21563]
MKHKIKPILRRIYYKLPKRERTWALNAYKSFRGIASQSGDYEYQTSITGDVTLLSRLVKHRNKSDILVFPVIDWEFRVQRPQHLARELAASGDRVIYLTTTFNYSTDPGFKILRSPENNVVICSLNCNKQGINIYKDSLEDEQLSFLNQSINIVRLAFGLGYTTSIVNLPFWRRVVESLAANHIVYDCMDHHAGFENNDASMLDEEDLLLTSADLVITTSQRLSDIISEKADNVIIRNGAEVGYFVKEPKEIYLTKSRPIVGYYGAIAEWFDIDLLVKCAKQYPQYDFVLIGGVTCDISKAEKLDNIKFLGEVAYDKLTGYLKSFDVCLIPFKLIELTLCTNPVKVYEYLAAGKPVVCTAMPEVKIIDDMVHVAETHDAFVAGIEVAMKEVSNNCLSEERKQWSLTHDWASRAQSLNQHILQLSNQKPKASLIVLTYNNLALTKECLKSIEINTYYDNYEVIIVDNMSTDDTREYLRENYSNRENYQLIFNEDNLGFAAGNNVGLAAAEGDILVILNNDTYVGPYWLSGLIRALEANPQLGLVGPVTNNIGNESKINISYDNWSEMGLKALEYCARQANKIYPIDCAAFFCVAFSREVYEKVGPMSLDYGLGFFEDDDYCMRVLEAGWKIAVVEDSFVHHHLSASFNKLKDNKKQELMDRNKAIFESKWGEWKPHKYRKGVY